MEARDCRETAARDWPFRASASVGHCVLRRPLAVSQSHALLGQSRRPARTDGAGHPSRARSEEHTSELQSRQYLVCRLLLEKKQHRAVAVATNALARAILNHIFTLVWQFIRCARSPPIPRSCRDRRNSGLSLTRIVWYQPTL